MIKNETKIKDCYIIDPEVYGDSRGYYSPYYKIEEFKDLGFEELKQIAESNSSKGVVRGLHYQIDPFAQAKIVRCTSGSIIDVVVDCREDSPTYGEYQDVYLTPENHKIFYVPRGLAHGFIALEDNSRLNYMVDNIYAPKSEGGILWNDPDLNIPWNEWFEEYNINPEDIQLKEADQKRKTLKLTKPTFRRTNR